MAEGWESWGVILNLVLLLEEQLVEQSVEQ